MPEGDLTRWVGIRPTNPSENIPVTESAPLTSIEVEPTAGSANFPVTESAPLTSIEVEPTAGSANFPVTESAPLTDILVAPSAGNPQFETKTEKRAPAICDLQAPESFVRVYEQRLNVGAPNYNHDIYTVPAGKVFVLEYLMGMCMQATPTSITFNLVSGGTEYTYYSAVYVAAWDQHRWTDKIIFNAGEIVRISWSGTLAGTDVVGTCFGYLIDKY